MPCISTPTGPNPLETKVCQTLCICFVFAIKCVTIYCSVIVLTPLMYNKTNNHLYQPANGDARIKFCYGMLRMLKHVPSDHPVAILCTQCRRSHLQYVTCLVTIPTFSPQDKTSHKTVINFNCGVKVETRDPFIIIL